MSKEFLFAFLLANIKYTESLYIVHMRVFFKELETKNYFRHFSCIKEKRGYLMIFKLLGFKYSPDHDLYILNS